MNPRLSKGLDVYQETGSLSMASLLSGVSEGVIEESIKELHVMVHKPQLPNESSRRLKIKDSLRKYHSLRRRKKI